MAYNDNNPRQPLHLRTDYANRPDLVDYVHMDGLPTPLTVASSTRSLLPQRNIVGQTSRPSLYSPSTIDSTDMLLPPRPRGPRTNLESPIDSPSRVFPSMSYRRESFDSMNSRDSNRHGPFGSVFDDSRAPSRADSDDMDLNTQTVSEKYNIMPSAGLLLFPEDVEKDDWLHNPDPNDKDRDRCDVFTKRGMVNVGGLLLICIGVLSLFIGYPVL